MTETSFYWNGIVTGDATLAPYTPDVYHTLWQKILTKDDNQGIVDNFGNELVVTGTLGGVKVDTGAALVDGTFYENTASVTVLMDTPAANPRIDRIVLRKDWTNQTVRIARVEGTEAASPTVPALTQTEGVIWEIPLAEVTITTTGAITVLIDEKENATATFSPNSGLTLIETISANGSLTSFDFLDIPQTFRHLKIIGGGQSGGAGTFDGLGARYNGDAAANYSTQRLAAFDATVTAVALPSSLSAAPFGFLAATGATANYAGMVEVDILNYTLSIFKTTLAKGIDWAAVAAGSDNKFLNYEGSVWENTDPITRITVLDWTDTPAIYPVGTSFSLYGVM